MKRIYTYLLGFIVCTNFLITLFYPCASFAEMCKQWVAKVVSVQGKVQAKRTGETQ